jgi:hypothetical protein
VLRFTASSANRNLIYKRQRLVSVYICFSFRIITVDANHRSSDVPAYSPGDYNMAGFGRRPLDDPRWSFYFLAANAARYLIALVREFGHSILG